MGNKLASSHLTSSHLHLPSTQAAARELSPGTNPQGERRRRCCGPGGGRLKMLHFPSVGWSAALDKAWIQQQLGYINYTVLWHQVLQPGTALSHCGQLSLWQSVWEVKCNSSCGCRETLSSNLTNGPLLSKAYFVSTCKQDWIQNKLLNLGLKDWIIETLHWINNTLGCIFLIITLDSDRSALREGWVLSFFFFCIKEAGHEPAQVSRGCIVSHVFCF